MPLTMHTMRGTCVASRGLPQSLSLTEGQLKGVGALNIMTR